MPLADGGTSKGIRKPRKPKAPVLPVTKAGPMFNPVSDISAGRVNEAIPQRVSTPRVPRSNIVPLTTQPNRNDIALSAVASLQTRQAQQAPSPYSGYAAMMQDNGYEDRTADVRSYLPTPEPPVTEFQDRVPEDTVTLDGIRQKVMHRLSRRGGQGIINPMSPIPGYEVGPGYDSDFGPRVHPVHGGYSNHTGDDISATSGTPILAPVGGVVTSSAATGGAYGNQVIMDHGRGQQTMFGHLQQLAVPPGTKVKKGEVIGYVGSTGLSTGPHLHHEQWQDGQPVDPSIQYEEGFNDEVVQQAIQRYMKNHPEAISSSNGNELGQMPSLHSQQRQLPDTAVPREAQPQNELAQNPQLNALMQAIREQESGGDYSVQNGIGARGAYQIMPSNVDGPGGWDAEALGAEITGEQFLNSPELQNKIAKFKLKDYFKKYGAEGAAKAWYAGPGNATLNSNAPQNGGSPVNAYADSVLNLMRKYL